MDAEKNDQISLCLKVALDAVNRERGTCYTNLKPKQAQCLIDLQNADVLGVLPTGYGKSLIFELLPYFHQAKCEANLASNPDVAVILISPLNSIIQEQLDRYGSRALHISATFPRTTDIKESASEVSDSDNSESELSEGAQSQACAVPSLPDKEQMLLKGQITYLIGHPEHIVCHRMFAIFRQVQWQRKHIYIVVDEAHCVIKWGPDFRKSFQDIHQLCGIFTKARMCALTATATLKMQSELLKQLHMMKNASIVTASIDRANIKINVKKRLPNTGGRVESVETSFDAIFLPVIEELKREGMIFPKTIIYAKLKWCGYGHEMATRPDRCGHISKVVPYVAQYHAPCTPKVSFVSPLCLLINSISILVL